MIRTTAVMLLAASTLMAGAGASAQVETRSGYVTFPTPNSVVVADFNRDGAMDFAVSSYDSNGGGPGVEVFLGNGDGTFKPPIKYVVSNGAGPLAVGDLNHDGIPDLVASIFGSNAVVVLLGNGDGTFQPPVTYATSGFPGAVVLGDFNNDGNLDIAATGFATVSVIDVLLGNGDGTFQEPMVTYPPSGALALTTGNFNGDKNLDLPATLGFISSDTAQILLGNGDGTFTLGESYALDPSSVAIVASDLRNNGITDLAVAQEEGGSLVVLLGNGDGTFEQPVEYDVGGSRANPGFPRTVAVGDMNGDGIPDLVSVSYIIANNNNYSAVYIFPGKGDGTFGSPEFSFPAAYNSSAQGLALADFNGDGQFDVTFADEFGHRNGVSEYVLLNTGNVKFSPITPLGFKNQSHGTTSPPQTVTLTNDGKAALSVTSIKTTGEFGATSTCGKKVAAKASCAISVTFSPKAAGAFSGTVQINDSASSKPQVIVLSGTGD